jgi:putative tricarboxylic transport membrane protein
MRADHLVGGALVLLALAVLAGSRDLPLGRLAFPGPGFMPGLLALLLLVFGVLIVVLGRTSPRLRDIDWQESRRAAVVFAVIALTTLAFQTLGFVIAVGLMLLVLVALVERQGILFGLVFALAVVLGCFYLFTRVLGANLPRGPLMPWLGF